MTENSDSDQIKTGESVSEPIATVSIEESFKNAVVLYKKKDNLESMKAFQEIIAQKPDMAEAHINLGNVYFKEGNVNDAISCWKKALSIDPNFVTCYVNIGNAHYSQGNIDDALPNWLEAVSICPDNCKALTNLGAAFEKTGNMVNAFRYYELCLRYSFSSGKTEYGHIIQKVNQSRKMATAFLGEGLQAESKKDIRLAVASYINAIRAYPNCYEGYLYLGRICYELERYKNSAKYWFQTIRCRPEDADIMCNLGVVYERLDKYDEAYCLYKRFLDTDKGSAFERAGVESRIEKIESYLEKHAELVRKHLERAEDNFKKRNYYEALWEYENYLILKPDQLSAYEYRITELKNILHPEKKAAQIAYDAAAKCYQEEKFENAYQAYRRYLVLDQYGEFADIAQYKVLELKKLLAPKSRK